MINKMKIVIDTSTLVSAFLFKNSVPYLAFKKAQKNNVMVVSRYTIDELLEVISRNKFNKYVSIEKRLDYVADFVSSAILIHPVYSVDNECRDVKDIPFLELATTAKAKIIISSDSDLLDLNPFNDITILKPVKFLKYF